MQYVGIDQHKRHLTICVRNEQGDRAKRSLRKEDANMSE